MARRNPEEWFWQVGTELSLTREIFHSGQTIVRKTFWEPRVDLLEDERWLILKAEIAGVRGDSIQLLYSPEQNAIVIRGTRHEEDYPDVCRTGCHQLEIYYGEFERAIQLPDVPCDPTAIKAQYSNGILTVLVPKGNASLADDI